VSEEDAAKTQDAVLGNDPASGLPVHFKNGRFGPYVQLGEASEDSDEKPKRQSIPKGWSAAEIDLDKALKLLSLPRDVGAHPEDGAMITAGIGRYGPFIKHNSTYANLKEVDEVFEVGINRAVDLIAEKKAGGGKGGRRGQAAPLKELGPHPTTGKTIGVYSGRYGPYVKHDKTNATLPKDITPETVTLEQAVDLVNARAAKEAEGGGKKGKAKAAPKPRAASKAKAAPKSKAAKGKAKTKKAETEEAETES
jgi:DNA topoisomerase-1